jgi:hypothetical protein
MTKIKEKIVKVPAFPTRNQKSSFTAEQEIFNTMVTMQRTLLKGGPSPDMVKIVRPSRGMEPNGQIEILFRSEANLKKYGPPLQKSGPSVRH